MIVKVSGLPSTSEPLKMRLIAVSSGVVMDCVSAPGASFTGWQSQADARGVQDALERALGVIADARIATIAAGRTDAGVHATMQVVHFDTDAVRPQSAWVRGVNSHLPSTIAVQWAQSVPAEFHAR